MMRITGWFSLILGFILFFIFQGKLDPVSSIAGGVVLLSILAVLMFTGSQQIIPPSISEEVSTKISLETSPVINIPPPVNEVESVSDKRDEKLKRSRRKSKEPSLPLPAMPLPAMPLPDPSQLPPPAMMQPPSLPNIANQAAEGTKLAKKLVVTSDAQSEMESEIEAFVDQRRSKQAEIRSSLERKRRMVLAERRAAKARLWTEVEDGEDLAALLQDPNHGLTILEEPEIPDESKPLGVSYIRIDNTRILKIKIPLEVEDKEKPTNESEDESIDLSDFPSPPGMPPLPPPPGMPPLPPPPGLPPLPPPPGLPPE
jgi:hypothetical protein